MFYNISSSLNSHYKYITSDESLLGFETNICGSCGRAIRNPIYKLDSKNIFVVDGGNIYPDYLSFCGAWPFWFILSERAFSSFESSGITGIESYSSVELYQYTKKDNIIKIEDAPLYYSLKLSGSIDFDYSSMFLKRKKICSSCGQFELNRQRLYPCFIDKSKWNEKDLCRLNTFPAKIICTDEVISVVKKNELTGFEFEQLKQRTSNTD